MARISSALASLSLASIALSSPLTTQQLTRRNDTTPCLQVASAVAAQTAATPTVDAQLAYDCISSVPFHQAGALALIDSALPYFKWQSNTAWLKDPPSEYTEKVQPAIDVWAGIEEIRSKVIAGDYESEFEVGPSLSKLVDTG